LLNLAAYLFLWEFFLVSAARRLYRLRRAFVETAMSARNEALWRELHSGFLAPEEFETKQAHLRKEDQFYLRLSYAVSLLVAQGLGAAVLFVAYGLPPTGLLWANFGILVTLSISAGLLAFSLSREDVLG